jgi:hypothetical protein
MTKAHDLYDCSPDTSNTDVQVKDDRRLLQDITGIFNFLASIGASLFLIFGFKRLVSTTNNDSRPLQLHFIWLLLLILTSIIVLIYGISGGGTRYSVWGLVNSIIPFVYVLFMLFDTNIRRTIYNITTHLYKDITPWLVLSGTTAILSIALFFILIFTLKNKKNKKVLKKNKTFVIVTPILSGIGSFIFASLFFIPTVKTSGNG